MSLQIHTVDAFTDQPFQGNPAGVCILKQPASESWMKLVAREMNLSETAFLYPIPDGFSLRWFTPRVEVDLCGHATLASAHILFETAVLKDDETARFSTRSGWLTAHREGSWIEMNFPSKPATQAPEPEGIAASLGVKPIFVGMSHFDLLVEVASPEEVRAAAPDFEKIKLLPVRGVIVTSRSDLPEFDFISRFFAPAVGVNEDPVTGSAHSVLAPFWAALLGKTSLNAYQASERGGKLRLVVRNDRVLIAGQAVTVMTGEIQNGLENSATTGNH